MKVKKLGLITDPKELGEYKHYEYSHTIKSNSTQKQGQKKSQKTEKKSKISQKTKKKSKPEEIKELELIVDPIETEKSEESHESNTEHASEQPQRVAKNTSEKQEIVKSSEISKEKINEITEQESKTQKKTLQNVKEKKQEKAKIKQKIEQVSTEILELREKYRQETGKRPIYGKKETKGFKEWLEKQKKLVLKKSKSAKKSESRGEWEILLEKWINEFDEKELSQEIKEELLNIVRKYRKFRAIYRKIIQLVQKENFTKKETDEIEGLLKNLEKMTAIQANMFRNLRAFQGFYNENILWYKSLIIAEKEKFIKFFAQKLKYLKKSKGVQKIVRKNWKEILKENLYKNITLSLKEKSIINEILQKEKLNKGDKNELISILSKLQTGELISLLGEDFENLKMFKKFYNKNIEWFKYRIILEKENFPKHLAWELDQSKTNGLKNKGSSEKTKKKILENKIESDNLTNNEKQVIKQILKKKNLSEQEIKNIVKHFLRIVELISIILGDGHISLNYRKYNYLCEVAINSKEKQYVDYIEKLFKSIFNVNPTIYRRVSDNTTLIRIFRKNSIEFLVKLGLVPGNKVDHQVTIPEWIKNLIFTNNSILKKTKKNITIAILKGLIDTDGSIYISWHKKKNYLSIGIKFTNASKPLIQDFREISEYLEIIFSKISKQISINEYGKKYISYSTSTIAKSKARRFIEIVKPIKWKIKKPLIEKKLDKFGLTIDAILKYRRYSPDFKKEMAIYFKILFEELGNFKKIRDFIIKHNGLPIKRETIANYVKNLLRKEGKSYESWLSLNSGIIVNKAIVGGIRIPVKIKKLICRFILNLILENKSKINNSKILNNLIEFLKVSGLDRLDYLLNNPKTKNLVSNFLKSSIILVSYLIANLNESQSSTNVKMNIKKLYSIDIPYHHSQIKEIMEHIFSLRSENS